MHDAQRADREADSVPERTTPPRKTEYVNNCLLRAVVAAVHVDGRPAGHGGTAVERLRKEGVQVTARGRVDVRATEAS